MNKNVIARAVALFALAVPVSASAADSDPETDVTPRVEPKRTPAVHADLETDPTAFVLGGGSAHLGLGYGRVRLDLGAYAMDMPAFMHGNAGFSSSFKGAGAKLQVFVSPHGEQRGAFVGIDGGVLSLHVTKDDADLSARQTQLGIGVHGGYRFELPWNLYATPWLGVGYSPNASNISLGGQTYKSSPISFFPAVHVGYRFH